MGCEKKWPFLFYKLLNEKISVMFFMKIRIFSILNDRRLGAAMTRTRPRFDVHLLPLSSSSSSSCSVALWPLGWPCNVVGSTPLGSVLSKADQVTGCFWYTVSSVQIIIGQARHRLSSTATCKIFDWFASLLWHDRTSAALSSWKRLWACNGVRCTDQLCYPDVGDVNVE